MAIRYIIDGYNLGFKDPDTSALIRAGKTDQAIRRIVGIVQKRLKDRDAQAVIYFDGNDGTGFPSTHKIHVRFSKHSRTADDEIRDFIRNAERLDNWVVVSSDNEIRYTAQDHGAKVMHSNEFLNLAGSTSDFNEEARQKRDPDNIDIDYWLRQFGAGDDSE